MLTDGDTTTASIPGETGFAVPLRNGVFGAREPVLHLASLQKMDGITLTVICDSNYDTTPGDRPYAVVSVTRTPTTGVTDTKSADWIAGHPFTVVFPPASYTHQTPRLVARTANMDCGITEVTFP
jgi:hypothetical protein